MWDKDGVIQFKSDHMAILQGKFGTQVEFTIAFEDLTKEGYELRGLLMKARILHFLVG